MRKSIILFVFSCFLLLFACSKNSDSTSEDDPNQVDISANLLGTGDSANDLLSNDRFTKIKIEIAYVMGFRPTVAAMNDFVDYIKKHTFKEDIELVFNVLDSSGKETLSLQEIVELESENRTVFNEGDTIGIYIYFADAPSDGDDFGEGRVTVGSVYRNTSMIIHESTVRQLSGSNPFITTADIESATVNHEFGHLFGLVNLGSLPVNDHEDPQAKSHCIVEGCLMRAELQFGSSNESSSLSSKTSNSSDLKSGCSLTGNSILKMLELRSAKGQAVAPDLDAECILDLQANGGR